MAKPAIVPNIVARKLALIAMINELRAASSISLLLNKTLYQSKVKPTHSAFNFESLNENMTTIKSGIYRKAYTRMDAIHKVVGWRGTLVILDKGN